MKAVAVACVLAAAVLAASPAGATPLLDGEQIRLEWLLPDTTTVQKDGGTRTVGPGFEWPTFLSIRFDASDTEIVCVMRYTASMAPHPFNGIRVTDAAGAIPAFTAVHVLPATNLPGFDASRVFFDDDHIYVHFGSLRSIEDRQVVLGVTGASPDVIPEPASLSLLALGALGLLARRRTK